MVEIAGKFLKKLETAVQRSRESLQPFRRKRLERIRELCGSNFSDNGTKYRVPVNFMKLAMNIYSRQLAPSNPRVLISTRLPDLVPAADDFELALNKTLEDIHFHKTLRRAVYEAMVGMGVIKVGLNRSKQVEIGGYLHDVGEPFADVVSLDDWVHDMSARSWEDVQFEGNYFRPLLSEVKACGLFKNTEKLQDGDDDSDNNEFGEEKAKTIQARAHQDDYKRRVDLLELWLPKDGVILTVHVGGTWTVLREEGWGGPETGPYKKLILDEIPDATIPYPPAALWQDLHELGNMIFTKLGDQAVRQKSILGVAKGDEEDLETLRNADDGDVVTLDRPGEAQEFHYGEINQSNFAFFLQVKDLFSWFAGNLDSLGGLSPMADTLGQDELLAASANKTLADMRDRTIMFTDEVITDIAKFLWDDPIRKVPIMKSVPGLDETIPAYFSADEQEGDFTDYQIGLDPYSLQPKTPSMQLQKLAQIMQQYIAPFGPMMEAQGMTLNFQRLVELLAKYSDFPELKQIVQFADPQMMAAQAGESRQSPVTHRVNERVSRSTGGTRTGRDQSLIQHLLRGAQPPQGGGNASV